jgi:conjugative relaxase-like TrwC/TraI family protein
MVARVTTLKATSDRLGALVDYYAGLADGPAAAGAGPVDYYLDPSEPPGRWTGNGRTAVGVDGEVSGDDLRALLLGVHPQTGHLLGRAFGDTSARGFDITFSAPKSVSVLWALTEVGAVRREVAIAHDAAVAATLEWVEAHGALSRRGRQGVHQVDTRGLAIAVFRQHTSRTADPQLHSHAIVSGKVQDETGRWLSLDARWLKQQQRSISYVYDAALRAELTARLGLAWEPVAEGAGHADLTAVPAALRDLFSQRARQVDAKLAELIGRWRAEHDDTDPDARTTAHLERRAVTASRPSKHHDPTTAPDLHAAWQRDAAAAGLALSAIPAPVPTIVPGFVPGSTPGSLPVPGSVPGFVPGSVHPLDRDALAVAAIARAAEESATWLPTDLSRHAAALLPPAAAPDAQGLVALVEDVTARAVARCVDLHPPLDRPTPLRRDGRPRSEAVTDRRLTTSTVWDEEARLLTWAGHNNDPTARRSAGDRGQIVATIAGLERLVLVVGPAGAGKTTLLADAIARLRRRQRPVLGVAPSGKAADVLTHETGCDAVTLAKLLADARRGNVPPPGTTIIVDEAGMAATDQLADLVHHADTYGWRLVCVGDPHQLPAVGRAGMFATWCDTLGAHHLDTVHRFTNPWEAHASLQLRHGHPDAAARYHQHHRLRALHPALIPSHVADRHTRLTARGKTVAITTATTSTARDINLEIQRRRPRTGRAVTLRDGTTAGAGDTITTRRNDPALTTTTGAPVRNRHTWTVDRVHADGTVTVSDPARGTVTLPARYAADAVELGWAVTGYGNQGTTTDAAIAVIEPASTRAGIYVALTRGRDTNHALVPDPTGTVDPEQALTDAIKPPGRALTAHAVQRQLARHDGPPRSLEAPTPQRSAGLSR